MYALTVDNLTTISWKSIYYIYVVIYYECRFHESERL